MAKNNISKNLKALRAQRGMSQEYLAEEAGVSLRTIQRIENKESVPTGETIKRISTALDVSLDELIGTQLISETKDIKSTIIFLKKKRSVTENTSDLKTLDNFINVLSNLKEKELSQEQTQGIESYINYLELEKIPSFNTELFQPKLEKFKTFLKKKLKFVPNNFYTKMGMYFTLPFTISFFITSGNTISNKIVVVVLVGILLLMAVFLDSRIKKQNRSLEF